jgi:hypothetical protein
LDIGELVNKLTPETVGCLQDMSLEPEAFRDWPEEVQEFKGLMRGLWAVCLSPLVKKLVSMCEARNGDKFRDHLFEALVAKKMLDHGAVLEYEPQGLGGNPVDFLVHLSDEEAAMECARHSESWYDVVQSKVTSALRRGKASRYGVDALLWTPEILDRDAGRVIEERLPNEVTERADRLGPEPGFEGPVVNGLVVVRIRRTSNSEPSSVSWDWQRPGGNWGDPEGLMCRRLAALWRKAKDKFRGIDEMGEAGLLRVLVVGWEGSPGRLSWMQDVIRGYLKSEVTGPAVAEGLDAVVFVRRANERLVEGPRFEAPIIVTSDADREMRVQRFLERMGADRGGHAGKDAHANGKGPEEDANK